MTNKTPPQTAATVEDHKLLRELHRDYRLSWEKRAAISRVLHTLDHLTQQSAATGGEVQEKCRDDGSFADKLRDALKPFADIGNRKAPLYIRPDDPIVQRAQRLLARSTSLLEPIGSVPPAGCHCTDICMAPRMMGRQQPCRREGGIPGQPVPTHPNDTARENERLKEAEAIWNDALFAFNPNWQSEHEGFNGSRDRAIKRIIDALQMHDNYAAVLSTTPSNPPAPSDGVTE